MFQDSSRVNQERKWTTAAAAAAASSSKENPCNPPNQPDYIPIPYEIPFVIYKFTESPQVAPGEI